MIEGQLGIQGTDLYYKIKENQDYKIIVLEGASRTSKTISVIQYFIVKAYELQQSTIFRCGRQKMTWTKETILMDWAKLVKLYDLPIYPSTINKNRSDQSYELNGHVFSFIGLDDPQKLHGLPQGYFWMNEAVEAKKDDFDQFEQRTDFQGILDYNPKYERHWIYDSVKSRPDCKTIHSELIKTKDGKPFKNKKGNYIITNPFITKPIIKKILSYEPTEQNRINGTADKNKWKIYGLGVPATIEGVIFDNVDYISKVPDDVKWQAYGLDFGFSNDPTAMVRISYADGMLYLEELIYETGLTSNMIANKFDYLGLTGRDEIYADPSAPMTIQELKNYGYNVKGATVCREVVEGIDYMRQYKLLITEKSMNFKLEKENYTWTYDKKEDKYINVPIDDFNHLWDASRYGITMKMMKKAVRYHG